jgi:hypothetical protein
VTSTEALLAATALHAGFQLVVTVLVYPALVAVPAEAFARAHDLHSRRIVPLVGVVYLAAAAACLGVLVAGPRTPATLLACAATAVAAGATASSAAPTHGRLGTEGPTPVLLRRLLLADRVRCAGAVVALLAALAATALGW